MHEPHAPLHRIPQLVGDDPLSRNFRAAPFTLELSPINPLSRFMRAQLVGFSLGNHRRPLAFDCLPREDLPNSTDQTFADASNQHALRTLAVTRRPIVIDFPDFQSGIALPSCHWRVAGDGESHQFNVIDRALECFTESAVALTLIV